MLFKSTFFARFSSLTKIDVSGARLSTIPATVVTCQGLTELVVDDNGLTTLPDLRACAKLRRISCGRCRMVKLPEWIGACARLVELDASSNEIASPLTSLRGCRALKTLQLRRNAMHELPRLPSGLTRLLVSGNYLDEISNVTDCVDLMELDLERNKLTALPDDLADLNRLEIINVSKNLLHSIEVPGMSRRAPKLREFKISSNPLGAVPWWLADVPDGAVEAIFSQECASIWEMRSVPEYTRVLDLGNRGLLHVPVVHPHLPNITTLKLSCNAISFLPKALSDLVLMRCLHLDDNFITFLPDLSRMTRLKELRVQGNRLAKLTPTICELVELEVLYIGRNPLTDLPDLTKCVALTTLWMAQCGFTALPLSIADVPNLTNFYCEGNPLQFPDPAIYDKGGNDEVIKHLRIVAENKKDQADLEMIRKKKAEAKAAKAAAKAMARMEREKRGESRSGGGDNVVFTASDESSDENESSWQRRRGSLRGSVASSIASRYVSNMRGSLGTSGAIARGSAGRGSAGRAGVPEGGGSFLSGWRGSVASGSQASGSRRNSVAGSDDEDDHRRGGGGRRTSRASIGGSSASGGDVHSPHSYIRGGLSPVHSVPRDRPLILDRIRRMYTTVKSSFFFF